MATTKIEELQTRFPLGTRMYKKTGSAWRGRVVGYYSTTLTPEGLAIESEHEPGSVQIYPAAAMESVPVPKAETRPADDWMQDDHPHMLAEILNTRQN